MFGNHSVAYILSAALNCENGSSGDSDNNSGL